MISRDSIYKIGVIGKPHGVKGEVTFNFDDDVFDRTDADYLILDVDGILVPFFMEEYRFKNDEMALMKFEDIDTQEQARTLTGCEVFFPREKAQEAEGEASLSQLVGFTLVNAEELTADAEKANGTAADDSTGTPVGTIRAIDDSTANLLLEVETPNGRQLLIPMSDDLITNIDWEGHRLVMRIPEGLLDLN
ncbi:ribosome maturation factor RimM [Prevotella sp. AGR2160]|uniref:ribosome maturation factor RimM n=1 Tax=Prevotella sp. AGR2160 TaxID=1280674 RepID=UPI000421FEBC|nr:ribosome maturation factor RimM [Prevotella sp. AGR2160]